MFDSEAFDWTLSSKEAKFQALLTKLSQHLNKSNIEQLCFLLRFPGAISEQISSGIKFFNVLKERKCISPDDVSQLKSMFDVIIRRDLIAMLNRYEEDIRSLPPPSAAATATVPGHRNPIPVSQTTRAAAQTETHQPSTRKRNPVRSPDLKPPGYFTTNEGGDSKGKGKNIPSVNEEPASTPPTHNETEPRDTPSKPVEGEDSLSNSFTASEETSLTDGPTSPITFAMEGKNMKHFASPVTHRMWNGAHSDQGGSQSQSVDEYSMRNNEAGLCIIISNRDFSIARKKPERTKMIDRIGTVRDQTMLEETFRWLRYDVKTHDNLTASMIEKVMQGYAEVDHSRYDSFVCCLLSHGSEEGIYGVDGNPVDCSKLYSMFFPSNCVSLTGKPKVFFVQACLGNVHLPVDPSCTRKSVSSHALLVSDFFVGYGTPPGYISWIHSTWGSPYINAWCKWLQALAHKEDLISICTRVNDDVSKVKTPCNSAMIAQPTFSLTKKLHFKPKSKFIYS